MHSLPLQLPLGHPDSITIGVLGRIGEPDPLVAGRFLAVLGENMCISKWKQGTLAQSNFTRSSFMKPLPRSVEWVDSITFPNYPHFTSERDERNAYPHPV